MESDGVRCFIRRGAGGTRREIDRQRVEQHIVAFDFAQTRHDAGFRRRRGLIGE